MACRILQLFAPSYTVSVACIIVDEPVTVTVHLESVVLSNPHYLVRGYSLLRNSTHRTVQFTRRKVSVDLSRGYRAVPHQFLHLVDPYPALDQPRGEGVAQAVEMQVITEARLLHCHPETPNVVQSI
jgi:hypothetical protein